MATSTPLSEPAQRERESADGRVATGAATGGETDGAAPREAPRDAPRGALPPTPRAPATLLAYAVSPGVRHAVGHAAHSVRHAVSRVLDRDGGQHARANRPPAHANRPPAHANRPPAGKPAARSDRSSVTHASSSPR